ncbi:DUF2790 domain-containing protein [Pseudomonas gingeri]|uniref:DUF2790 domain-containing protein n=1 Tax=Pseudomonas gingeri TaxID=117681 RepID=A0A7Y8C285_9PSED|nr:DUF2790 domain-containing protein [Pseudomonas gingeri]NWA25076.1 DUF2790 domain-containing protein [Pseudomonas gingeri]NWB96334.1 DUF2790 domain-containing protein [Pseudomonas gingeri]NWD71907.1 DUF2790 domain-containing protein [Pseudomonas gingeri]NWD75932.1 DUF2790 domain-containing protein [Pseudomonas gingeri]
MNLRTLLMTGTLALSAFAGMAQADTTAAKPVPYQYGMHLDIAKVVSMNEQPSRQCKVVKADMKYIDSAGRPEDMTYSKMSDSCEFNN